jgi:sigma-B regulation protein RsbU (phosphoserine phosphatase)
MQVINDIFVYKENGEMICLKKGGIMLGFADLEFEFEEILLNKNDLVVLYTDGVNEAMSKDGEFFGDERLIDAIKAGKGLNSGSVLKNIINQVQDFEKGIEQSDDITCGVIKVL